jgi:hypothetical protein
MIGSIKLNLSPETGKNILTQTAPPGTTKKANPLQEKPLCAGHEKAHLFVGGLSYWL